MIISNDADERIMTPDAVAERRRARDRNRMREKRGSHPNEAKALQVSAIRDFINYGYGDGWIAQRVGVPIAQVQEAREKIEAKLGSDPATKPEPPPMPKPKKKSAPYRPKFDPVEYALPEPTVPAPVPASLQIVSDIIEETCHAFGASRSAMVTHTRSKAVAHPRHVARWVARELTQLTLAEIGFVINRADHTTVMSSIHRVEYMRQHRPESPIARHSETVARVIAERFNIDRNTVKGLL